MENFYDLEENLRDVSRAMERESECLMERAGWLKGLQQLVRQMDEVVKENEQLKEENEELRQHVAELCKSNTPMAFYNYGTYNEVQGGALNLIKKN